MTAPRSTSRRSFGRTWWGRAWVDALEQRARLDPNRLPRGRTYARKHRVGNINVSPGLVKAAVQGSRVTPYLVQVRVRVLDDAEWDRVFDVVAAQAGRTAALLDGELPPQVVSDAASAGVELLPTAGEVGPRCSCPDWADPCKHAAAVIYLVAEVLDKDPFGLLLVRGRSKDEVLAALRQRRVGSRQPKLGSSAPQVDAGVLARDAFGGGPRPELPKVPLAPRQPGEPAPLAVDPPFGVRSQDLAALAADAARRAWALCTGEGDGGLNLEPALDLVRLAAATGRVDEIAKRAGLRPRELGRSVSAWRLDGADALAVLGDLPSADDETMEEGRAAVGASARVRVNRVTSGHVQLRVSPGGAWYRFEKLGGTWELIDGPAADPASLVGRAPA